jgi:hypothetical protein
MTAARTSKTGSAQPDGFADAVSIRVAVHPRGFSACPVIEEWKFLAELIDTAFDDFNEIIVFII